MKLINDGLTDEQRAVVWAPLDGPFVVDAGAGTGKTFTLVRRALRLVESDVLKPGQLLVLTFTTKAANEIAERLDVAFGAIGAQDLPICATFHSLAASLLREFAYETGLSPDLHAIDDPRARGIFRRAYDDLLAGRLQVDLSALPILERERELIRDLATLALSLKNQSISIDRFEREALAAVPALRDLPFGDFFVPGKRVGSRTKLEPVPPRTREEIHREAAREEKNVLAVAALFRHFDALLAESGLFTYGDLLTHSVAMLEAHPSIVERLRRRWRHALVDEFQDTNLQQLRFLRAIFGEKLRPVMAVGDYRQAIYEWNGANPRGILDLKEQPGTKTLSLTLNRRSFQEILDAAHAVLPEESAGEPLVADAGVAAPSVALRHGSFGDAGNTAECRKVEAEAIATEIAQLVAGGVARRDIAILLRARGSARVYADALRKRGISSRTHGGVGFFDAPEIVDAVAWFRLMIDAENRGALARVLESPAVGVSDGTAALLFEHRDGAPPWLLELPDWLTPFERHRLERFRATLAAVGSALGLPVAEAVRVTLRETAVDVARAARNPDESAQIEANVAKLVSLAEGFGRELPLARLADFVAEIDTRAELEDDESVAELGGEDIAIMTIHGAKGLEWKHVFVANVSPLVFPSNRGPGEIKVQRDPLTKALAFSSGIDGKTPLRWFMRIPHDPQTGERPEKVPRDTSEEERLFYVAITRAKQCVWISGVRPTKTESKFLAKIGEHVARRAAGVPFGSARAFADEKDAFAQARARSRLLDQDLERLRARISRPPTLFERWEGKLSYTAISTYSMCPRLARYRYVLRVPDFRETPDIEQLDYDVAEPVPHKIDAATYGNIIHRALEMVANERIAARIYSIDEIVHEVLSEFQSKDDDALRVRVTSAVTRSVEALAALEPISAEEEFDATISGAQVGGFIDLIARDDDGAVWIIDYKTGAAPDEAYALQLALYRIAVRATYPKVRLAILRIGDRDATLSELATPEDRDVERAVAEAAAMDRDEPRTGRWCETCPYAGRLCPEGSAHVKRLRETSGLGRATA